MNLKLGIGLLIVLTQTPMTARDYYKEIRSTSSKTHALNSFKDEYVCFRDDEVPTFLVMGRREDIINQMKETNDTDGVKAVSQLPLNSLIVTVYHKGVAQKPLIYLFNKETSDYSIEFHSPIYGKMTYAINWDTGRYRQLVYDLKISRSTPQLESSGKCELIHLAP